MQSNISNVTLEIVAVAQEEAENLHTARVALAVAAETIIPNHGTKEPQTLADYEQLKKALEILRKYDDLAHQRLELLLTTEE